MTMIPAAASTWNSSCGPQRVVEDLHRHRRVAVGAERRRVEGDEDRWRRPAAAAPSRRWRGRRRGSRRWRCPGSRPAAPGGGSSATGSPRAPASPARIECGHGADRLARGDDHHRQHQQRQGQRAGGEDEAEVERPADDEGEPEDAVDDRGHRGEVLDVDLDQPVPPARACPRTPRGRAAAPTPIGTTKRITPAISSSEPMIAGR